MPNTAEIAALEGLNPEQRLAVESDDGPRLVIAGAGSGKTRVLAHRIAYLLATRRARPGEILAITFTNKAANEMRERVTAQVGPVTRAMWVTTFHSACARMLRGDAERLGYARGFTIYDESDSLRMIKRCMQEAGVDAKRFPPRAIRNQISGAKNRLIDPETFASANGSYFEEAAAEVYGIYERRLIEANAMDFDDLLVRMVNLLELDSEARNRWQRQFRHVLVDEYQDTNHAQYRLLQLLAEQHRNLFVVGDEDQSIYGFRHADIRNILDFEQDFPEAQVLKLERNYRSTQTILSAANAVVAHNRDRRPKKLWTDLGAGDLIEIAELGDEYEEARWLTGEVERLVAEEDVSRDQIAVFYRMNSMSRVLEEVLNNQDLPYQMIGGTKFYDRAEVKDALAYLSLLLNPADLISFGRVINSPKRGIGKTSQARLAACANTTGLTISEVIESPAQVPGLGPAAIKAVERFAELIAGLREAAAENDSVAHLLEQVLARSGYRDALEAERSIEAEGRLENLDELLNAASDFDQDREREEEPELSPLEQFMQRVSLASQQDELEPDESRITLMTLHNAKGLEYEVVFIIGCEEGVFPHSRALEAGEEEEERRLCYVGITRARRLLHMSWARERRIFGGRSERGLPSRFLDELPPELTERYSSGTGLAATSWRGQTRFGRDRNQGGGGFGSFDRSATGGIGRPGLTAVPGAGPAQRRQPGKVPAFAVGDDVEHSAFGEGVVTGAEAGGVVLVRFAADGSERKLMADYAPLTRRAS